MSDKIHNFDELLISKTFSELTVEERNFVLKNVKDENEYFAFRQIVMEIRSIENMAPFRVKSNVIKAFDEQHQSHRRKSIWWKSDKPWYQQPLVATLAAAAIITLVLIVLPFNHFNDSQDLAELKNEQINKTEKIQQNKDLDSEQNDNVAGDSVNSPMNNNDVLDTELNKQQSKNQQQLKNYEPTSTSKSISIEENYEQELSNADAIELNDRELAEDSNLETDMLDKSSQSQNAEVSPAYESKKRKSELARVQSFASNSAPEAARTKEATSWFQQLPKNHYTSW